MRNQSKNLGIQAVFKSVFMKSRVNCLCLAIICVLILVLSPTLSITCSQSSPNSNTSTSEKGSISGISGLSATGVVSVPSSTNIYIMYTLSLPSQFSILRKVDSSGTSLWTMKITIQNSVSGYSFEPKSLGINQAEASLCFAATPSTTSGVTLGTCFICIKPYDGTIASSSTFSDLLGTTGETKIHLSSDNLGYYVLGKKNISPTIFLVCYFTFSSSSIQCKQLISFPIYFGYGQLMISDGVLYTIGFDYAPDSSNKFYQYFYRLDFKANSIDWISKLQCSYTENCYIRSAESLISSDKSKIYSFYFSGNIVYFLTLDTSAKSIISQYKINQSTLSINGSILQRNFILVSLTTSTQSSSLLLVNYQSSPPTFTTTLFYQILLYQIAQESRSGRIIVVGATDIYSYISKFMIESISLHPDLCSTCSTVSVSTSSDTINKFVSTSSANTELISYEQVISSISALSQTISFSVSSSKTSAISYNTYPQKISITSGTASTQLLALPCSLDGSTIISYTISGLTRRALLSNWATIDSSSGIMTINPSGVSSGDYNFAVNSQIGTSSNLISQIITISVSQTTCTVLNCNTCSSSTICVVCNDGYSLSSGSCIVTQTSSSSSTTETVTPAINADPQLQSTAVAAQTTTVTTVAVSAGAVGASNAASSTSSPAGFWCMVNQLQLFFLLLLTKAFLPDSVKSVIGGANSAMMNPFEYIPFLDSKKYGEVFEKFNFELNNSALKPFKIKSVSTFYNSFSIMLGIFYIILFHVVIFLIRRFVLVCGIQGKCGKVIKLLKTIVNKVFDILTFGFYVRLLLEINQFFLVSGMNEVFFLDVSEDLRIVSFTFAVLVLLACFIFIVLVTYFSLVMDTSSESGHNKFSEFFSGLRLNKRNRLFISILITRRSLLVVLLFALSSIPSRALIGVLVAFDVPYVIYLIILRPYNETKYNIIEIMNEFIFLLLLSALLVFNTESDWTKTSAYIYIQILSFNCVFSMIVIIIFLIISIVVWIKNRKRNNQTKVEPFKENKEDQHPTMEAMAEPQSMERMTKFKDTKRVNEIKEEMKQENNIQNLSLMNKDLKIYDIDMNNDKSDSIERNNNYMNRHEYNKDQINEGNSNDDKMNAHRRNFFSQIFKNSQNKGDIRWEY